jgi:integrase
VPTPYKVGEERKATRYAEAAQRKLNEKALLLATGKPLLDTVRAYSQPWLVKRREQDLDWKNDASRLNHHVLPVIGDMKLEDVRSKHIAALVHRWRFVTKLAQRTVYNVYSVVSALFRDAAIDGEVDQTPCILTVDQLGPLEDSDPEWRDGAVFSREEAEALISDSRIPFDRQLVYGFGVLAGLRPGECAALRWKHYDANVQPLGKLTVAKAYNTRKHREKVTKTRSVRRIPVHATLAAMLAEWKLSGWAAMMGRQPTPEDLIVPLPPKAAARRRTREGDAYRGHDYIGKRWREEDMKALGWRYREPYATKSTFITLVLEDGAKREIIRERVTHVKPRKDAFDGYDRGPHWLETCAEVAKLRLTRKLATPLATVIELSSRKLVEAAGVEPFGFIFLDEHLPDSSRQTSRTVPANSAD